MTPLLSIQSLSVSIKEKPLINNLSLDMYEGEIHALMGPNGTGKSTLAKVLSGNPLYEVTSGTILFQGKNLLNLLPEERASMGLFIGFQYPVEIPGVSNATFFLASMNAQRKANNKPPLSDQEFQSCLKEKMALIDMKTDFKERNVNEGFSGGEKKRNEILQMALLQPTLAVLDEIDSGLDIDALRSVAHGVHNIRQENPRQALLLITHYQRLLHYITPHVVHVMIDGTIVQQGGPELAVELEKRGYMSA